MKKILLLISISIFIITSICSAAPAPTKKIVLFYKVQDAILQCQNSKEDMIEGAKEFEKELMEHYSKRFIVEDIKRIPVEEVLPTDEYFAKVKFNQTPFLVILTLEGQGYSTQLYQNAFGAQKIGAAPSTNVHLMEAVPDNNDKCFKVYDYKVQAYTAGTFAVGRTIFAAETDPRKNTKNAIRGCIRDACKFNESINKYANPKVYEIETSRFTGNFQETATSLKEYHKKTMSNEYSVNARIEKFKAWCAKDSIRKPYLNSFQMMTTNELKLNFIDTLIAAEMYVEE